MLEMRPFTLVCTLPRLTLFYLFILSFLPSSSLSLQPRREFHANDHAFVGTKSSLLSGLPTLNLTYMKTDWAYRFSALFSLYFLRQALCTLALTSGDTICTSSTCLFAMIGT